MEHVHGSSLYLMIGTRDVTTCADIVYGKHFRTHFSLISLVSAKNDFSGARPYLDVRYSRTVYAITILTSPLRRVNSALQRGTNISISKPEPTRVKIVTVNRDITAVHHGTPWCNRDTTVHRGTVYPARTCWG